MVVSLFSLPPAAGTDNVSRIGSRHARFGRSQGSGSPFLVRFCLQSRLATMPRSLVENAVEHRRRLDVEDHHLAGCLARVLVGAPHGVEREHERRIAPPVAHPLHVHACALVVAEHVGHEPFHERGEVRVVGLAAPHSRAELAGHVPCPRGIEVAGFVSAEICLPLLRGRYTGVGFLRTGLWRGVVTVRCVFRRVLVAVAGFPGIGRNPGSGWVPPRAGLPAPRVRSASARLGPGMVSSSISLSSGMCGASGLGSPLP